MPIPYLNYLAVLMDADKMLCHLFVTTNTNTFPTLPCLHCFLQPPPMQFVDEMKSSTQHQIAMVPLKEDMINVGVDVRMVEEEEDEMVMVNDNNNDNDSDGNSSDNDKEEEED